MSTDFAIGSIWRKWDLHVHTPASIIQNYGGDSDEVWENYVTDLEKLPTDYKVVGINDYLFLEGYRKILDFKKKGRLSNIITFFPVLEFRISKFGNVSKDDPFSRINLHIIFSNMLDPDIIEAQFIKALQNCYYLTPDLKKWNGVISKESLIDFGSKINESSPAGKQDSNVLKVGFNNLNFDEEKVFKQLKSHFFEGKFLTAVGKTEWEDLRWDGSSADKKTVINQANLVFTASDSPESYYKAKESLSSQKVNDNLIDCSDAHNFSNTKEKDRIGNCFTWIKTDPTFEGLKQILIEPDERIWIGINPPAKDHHELNLTKYIKQLHIDKINGSKISEVWFDKMEPISFNSGLVAIVGNKGSGKSAISDILGLLGNSYNYNDFSFLNSDKFLKKKPFNRAENFQANLTWGNDYKTENILLNHTIDRSLSEKVKYIPQNFLEKLCTDVDNKVFENELRDVVFSHLDDSQKMNQKSFEDLIRFRSTEIQNNINNLKSELAQLNIDLSLLEEKKHPDFIRKIKDLVSIKSKELSAHDKLKPKFIKKPVTNNNLQSKQKVIYNDLEANKKELQKINDTIQTKIESKKGLNIKLAELENFLKASENLVSEISSFKNNYEVILKKYDFEFSEIFSYKLNKKKVQQLVKRAKSELIKIEKLINPKEPKSLIKERERIEYKISEVTKKLDEPFKVHQEYLEKLETWQNERLKITGNINQEDTLEYYLSQKKYVEKKLNKELENKTLERKRIVESLYKEKTEILNIFKDAYKPVMELIGEIGDIMEDYKINFNASFRLVEFQTKFFNVINQGSKGSFIGKIEGLNELNNLLEESSFESFNDTFSFIEKVIKKLHIDSRTGRNKEIRYVKDQLKQGFAVTDLYRFLFELDFLENNYELKLGDKNITELSPGERGALLLIFYLLLDKREVPLIIDQPEENLDNQSVYNLLVRFIKNTKKKRQVIIVTHNPNLAVVCDAEQIIRVKIDKKKSNVFNYIAGSIENPKINKELVDILEGTFPAFNNRRYKYELEK